jgi:ABC-type polysaccharide/polyol phosphate export permease
MNLAEHLRELWAYRELTYNLVVRDLKVRYKNSVLGVLWSLLNPLLMMLVFTFVFGVMYSSRSPLPAYPAFILSGILAWNLFSSSVTATINSVVGNAHLIKKVYFPREILPLSTVLANLVNYLLGLLVYFVLATALGRAPTPWVLLLPVVILVQLCFTLGISFILATVNVFYRDTRLVMEVVMLAWFFMTPIFYSIDQVLPNGISRDGLVLSSYDAQRLMRIVNPMASIISSYRDVLYRGAQPGIDFFMRTAVTALFFLVVGYLFFLRFSPIFGEEI